MKLKLKDAIRNENPPEPVDVEELTSRNGHSLTWERYHSLDGNNLLFRCRYARNDWLIDFVSADYRYL